jgi:hypothetical protein
MAVKLYHSPNAVIAFSPFSSLNHFRVNMLYKHCRHLIRILQIVSWFTDSQKMYIPFLLFLFKYLNSITGIAML